MRRRALGLAAVALLCPAGAGADGEAVDPEAALPILLRVLAYDKAFKSHGEGDFVILVPAEAGGQTQRDRVLQVARGLKVSSIQNRALRYVPVEAGAEALDRAVAQEKPSAVLITGGLSGPAQETVHRASTASHLYTLSLDPGAVEQKRALLGVAAREGRPQILLNVEGARELNASFDNAVLRLARLIQ